MSPNATRPLAAAADQDAGHLAPEVSNRSPGPRGGGAGTGDGQRAPGLAVRVLHLGRRPHPGRAAAREPCAKVPDLPLPPLEPRALTVEEVRSLKNVLDRLAASTGAARPVGTGTPARCGTGRWSTRCCPPGCAARSSSTSISTSSPPHPGQRSRGQQQAAWLIGAELQHAQLIGAQLQGGAGH
jgi:hypothetical protein